ncbi:unnamed protein product [Victoria cruziana]
MATASAAPVVPAVSPPKSSKISFVPRFSTQRMASPPAQSRGLLRRENGPAAEAKVCRREVMKVAGLLWALWKLPAEAKEVEVGSYLPPSSSDPSFVVFKATPKDTPALRAGNVQPYEFILPPTWKQQRVANILSGNYCQPKCAEPWVEVKFEDEKQGKIQVVASPLIRLTNKPNATLEEIGSPEKLIASLGPFVTGDTFDPDELVESSIERRNGQTVSTTMTLSSSIQLP